MIERLKALKEKIVLQKGLEKELTNLIANRTKSLKELQEKFYDLEEEHLHLSEILRLAKIQFPRLRNQPESDLTPADYAELEKWISRAKTSEGLKAIVIALKELAKYYPHDIKSNLYGLVQKIIIEGPFKKAQKKT